jgi:hypothetical protein
MPFIARPAGYTLRRVQDALVRPHDPAERMDPDFPVAMRCEACGKFAHGPRHLMAEAMREHRETACPARHYRPDDPIVTRILFPRT